ncbi:hypothetical protein D9757_006698 [Collybiopsis confluens]|uniref:Cytochrome P450 n=1 Tax=Collybiopsis confluens TaxID=2823264 RepID=A0A8H5HN32_9AGAR|nr:hypothetical protein D9757_006698 [Collybiopsis confluens]
MLRSSLSLSTSDIMIESTHFSASYVGLVVLVLILLYHVYQDKSRRSAEIGNLPGPQSPSWLRGNFLQVFNSEAWGYHEFLAKEYGSMVRLHGPAGSKTLYTFDPKAMHNVLVKDQEVFEENDGFIQSNLLMWGDGLLGTLGHRHRKQRKMLNPVFSAAHMRGMIPSFFDVTHKLENALTMKLKSGSDIQEIDILSWMGRTALELIGQAGLGYSFDPLVGEESAHPYSNIIKQLVYVLNALYYDILVADDNIHASRPALMRVQFWRTNLLPRVCNIGTARFRRFVVNLLPWKDLHDLRDMADYMYETATGIYESKKQAFEEGDERVTQQIGGGKDLISILMKENMKATEEDRLEDSEVISQMKLSPLTLFCYTQLRLNWCKYLDFCGNGYNFGQFSAMARILHLLSRHPEVQDKLRDELIQARQKNGGQDLSYDDLVSLPYLDAICRETLRLYSPVPIVARIARKEAVIPLSKPVLGLDGTEMHQVAVPKGTNVIVSIFNSNRNTDLWGKDANEWKPERWLSPLPNSVIDARIPGVYSHLMTFIGGGRSCIGFKFSQLEMKVVMSILVEKFRFSPSAQDAATFWQMNGITAPVVGEDKHPQLPIRMSLAK